MVFFISSSLPLQRPKEILPTEAPSFLDKESLDYGLLKRTCRTNPNSGTRAGEADYPRSKAKQIVAGFIFLSI